ncbi:MAG: hypothetical protein ABIA37_00855 [Candidatus Woesearchaeota archaeon]
MDKKDLEEIVQLGKFLINNRIFEFPNSQEEYESAIEKRVSQPSEFSEDLQEILRDSYPHIPLLTGTVEVTYKKVVEDGEELLKSKYQLKKNRQTFSFDQSVLEDQLEYGGNDFYDVLLDHLGADETISLSSLYEASVLTTGTSCFPINFIDLSAAINKIFDEKNSHIEKEYLQLQQSQSGYSREEYLDKIKGLERDLALFYEYNHGISSLFRKQTVDKIPGHYHEIRTNLQTFRLLYSKIQQVREKIGNSVNKKSKYFNGRKHKLERLSNDIKWIVGLIKIKEPCFSNFLQVELLSVASSLEQVLPGYTSPLKLFKLY